MILIDTSAWIEFLRGTDSPTCDRVDELLAGDIATCDPVRMEVFAGARSAQHLRQLRALLARANKITTLPTDYENVALHFRTCRRSGETIRKLVDCLIASHAIRSGIPVLHADGDFDALARRTGLEIAR